MGTSVLKVKHKARDPSGLALLVRGRPRDSLRATASLGGTSHHFGKACRNRRCERIGDIDDPRSAAAIRRDLERRHVG